MQQTFDITGMTCSACSARVEKCVSNIPGVSSVSVNLLTNSMRVETAAQTLASDEIIRAVMQAGYGATPRDANGNGPTAQAAVPGNPRLTEIRDMRGRLLLSVLFLLPLLYLAMHHMLWEWVRLPIPSFMTAAFHGPENAVSFGLAQFLLLLPILYANRHYFSVGFRTLWQRSPNMDSLIAIGSMAATLYGLFAIFRIGYGLGHGDWMLVEQYRMDLYFESAGTILTLITLGKFLETKSKGRTSEAIEKLIDLAPQTALVERDGVVQELPIAQVVLGDLVLLKPGSSVPVDGVVIEGASHLDESAMTGESIPVEKTEGDTVLAGTMNQAGFLKLRTTRIGADTTLSQIIRLVEDASADKAPIAKLADRIAGVFVPVVIGIALLSAVVWVFLGASLEFALSIGISVLVISCPCALGLATPVAVMVGTGKGAEHGILIKTGEALEHLRSVDTVILDKTGTITEGKPRVVQVLTPALDEGAFLTLAAGLEAGSEHPLAAAIVSHAAALGVVPAKVSDFVAVFGKGVTGRIDGCLYHAGNAALLEAQGVDLSAWTGEINRLADEGMTPILFGDETHCLGIIGVADTVKASSRAAIAQMLRQGLHVVMLTGDHQRTAQAIQKQLAIPEIVAQVLPQDKERHVAAWQEKGHRVCMVGDGINDAPALTRADIGMAIGAGTDVAIESADVVLMHSDLMDAVRAIRLSRATMRNIKQNLFWAFFYNVIGIPLAAGLLYLPLGWKLNPMFAAAAMSLSSVFVVLNALRLKTCKLDNHTMHQEDLSMQAQENKLDIMIEGMSCNHCSGAVEKALTALPGVTALVSLEEKKAAVTAPQTLTEEQLRSAVEAAGYTVTKIQTREA